MVGMFRGETFGDETEKRDDAAPTCSIKGCDETTTAAVCDGHVRQMRRGPREE